MDVMGRALDVLDDPKADAAKVKKLRTIVSWCFYRGLGMQELERRKRLGKQTVTTE